MTVSRLDAPERNFAGWVVRYRHRDAWMQRYFADERFGAADAAREAAQAFLEAEPEQRLEAIALARRLRSRRNSKAGMIGVTRLVTAGRPPNWMAYWTDEAGERRFKRFSVAIFGEEEAMRLAIEHRMAMTQPDIERLQSLMDLYEASSPRPPPIR